MRKILSIVLVFYSDDACEIAAVEICEEKSFDLPRRKPLQLWLAFIPWGVFFEGSLKGPRRGGGGTGQILTPKLWKEEEEEVFFAFLGFSRIWRRKKISRGGKRGFRRKRRKRRHFTSVGRSRKKVGKLKNPGRYTFLFLPICCVLIKRVCATTTGCAHTSVLRDRNSPAQNQIRK